jgi:N-acetylglutamate synthase-like GNAT family acetyltransferase
MPKALGREPRVHDGASRLHRHSLRWVCAQSDGALIGFVNVAWDGGAHAFVVDTVVAARHRHRGAGSKLVGIAAREAAKAGCDWLHADSANRFSAFYFDSCGFTATKAGLI